MQSKLFSEMVLIDADQNRAEGEALDISHGMAFASPMKIYAGTYDDVSDASDHCDYSRSESETGETRLDLIQKNAKDHADPSSVRSKSGILKAFC